MTMLPISNGYQVYPRATIRALLVNEDAAVIPAWSELVIEGIDPDTIRQTLKKYEKLKRDEGDRVYSLQVITDLFKNIILPYQKGVGVSAQGILRFEVNEKTFNVGIVSDQNFTITTDSTVYGISVVKLVDEIMKDTISSNIVLRNIRSMQFLDIDMKQLKMGGTVKEKLLSLSKAFNKTVQEPCRFELEMTKDAELEYTSPEGASPSFTIKNASMLRIQLHVKMSERQLKQKLLNSEMLKIPPFIPFEVTELDPKKSLMSRKQYAIEKLPMKCLTRQFESAIFPYTQDLKFVNEGKVDFKFAKGGKSYTFRSTKELTILPSAPSRSYNIVQEAMDAVAKDSAFQLQIPPNSELHLEPLSGHLLERVEKLDTNEERMEAVWGQLNDKVPENYSFYVTINGAWSAIPQTDQEGQSSLALSSSEGMIIGLEKP